MNFEDIRPYNDTEIREVLDRIIVDPEFLDAMTGIKYPRLTRWFPWLVRFIANKKAARMLRDVQNIEQFQAVVADSLGEIIDNATEEITIDGLEELDAEKAHLFIGNHRDIAMDPALVGIAMQRCNRKTLRIAIGDNLLTKPFVSDLMRLNRSFIVKRSIENRREKMKALQQLSAYIRHSLTQDNWPIWIAQREGRAKDGLDRTDTALLKMIMLSKQKEQSFAEAAHELHVVPISVSYELDPCDAMKARELYMKAEQGGYQKGDQEDIQSIYEGIVGEKGRIHVSFGKPLELDEVESADVMAAAIDRHIIENYKLFPTNILAYEWLHGEDQYSAKYRAELNMTATQWQQAGARFRTRMDGIDQVYRSYALASYANPLKSKIALLQRNTETSTD